jgi:probable HAF family extracellular repeat protein
MRTSNKKSACTFTSKWNRWALRVAIAFALAFVFAVHTYPQAPPPPQVSWTLTDLGNLSSTRPADFGAEATSINSSGKVIGISGEYSGGALGGFSTSDAFIWTPTTPNATTGTMTFMGGLVPGVCGAAPATGTSGTAPAYPVSINDSGEVAANSQTTIDSSCPMAVEGTFTYLNGSIAYLGGPPGFYKSTALSINNSGEIVGDYHKIGSNSDWTAWLYDGAFHDLGVLPDYPTVSTATKINNVGQIAGFVETVNSSRAFRHSGSGALLETDLLGTLGGSDSAAYGINDTGIVVGASSIDPTSSTYHAFVYDLSGKMRDLGTASSPLFAPISTSWAYAINKSNDVVGMSDVDDAVASNATHAVIWKNMVKIIDLNTLLDPKLQPTPDCATCWELLYAVDINDMGQIVGAGLLDGELHAFLLSPPCLTAGGDTDGDGLCDDWEKNGYTDPKTGQFVDLPHMGAHWDHKDIFVQADYMVDSTVYFCTPPYVSPTLSCGFGHTHKPNPDAMAMVIQAFADAPVENPDGLSGINIHIDCGRDCIMNPETGETWGDFSLAQAIDPEITPLGSSGCLDSGVCLYDLTNFNSLASQNFTPTGRSASFHYMVFAHDLGVGIGAVTGLGYTPLNPGSNFMVGLGSLAGEVGTKTQQAVVFMHELGHNLGLMHGGTDDINHKPNYLSIMNYSFSLNGVIVNGASGFVNYSPFSSIPPLDEFALSEQVGLNGGSDTASFGTRYYCFPTVLENGMLVSQQQYRFVPNANGPIDWNCDGTIQSNVLADGLDINGDLQADGSELFTHAPLISSNDWLNLIYAGGAIGGYDIVQNLPTSAPTSLELPFPVYTEPYQVQLVSPGLGNVLPGNTLNLNYTLTNTGTQPDTYNLTPMSQYTWWDTSGVPSTVALAGGASRQITIPVTVPATIGCSNVKSIQAAFTLRVVSQAHPAISDSGVAELDLISSPTASPVPAVIGLTQSEAQAAIVGAGFIVATVTTNSSSTVPAGTVISQNPSGCALAAPGAAISLVISTGPAFVAMPNVVGETQSNASIAITSAGLVLGSISTTTSPSVPAGMVISESPAAGTNVLVGSSAGILVSSGASFSNVVPNVVGQSAGAADSAIVDAGLVVGTTTGSVSSTVTAGTVISETPTAGTSVLPGSSVNLTVSVGASSFTVVPNFTGDTLAQLESAIPAAGLVFGGVGYISSLTVPAGQVISQNPLAGVFTSTGTPVYLAISAGLQPNTVPNLYGLSQSIASAALSAVGLKVGTVSPYPSGIYPPGYVLSQNPAPGNYATAGSTVSLTVASDPTQFIVPDLSATNAALGYEAIATAGLTVGSFTTAVSSTVSQGLLISQTPAAGTIVAPGSAVNAVYSAGSHLYPVPNVVGQGQDLATDNIRSAFFYLAVTRQSSTTVPDGVVISETPAGGSQALLGAIISLVVSSGGPVMSTVPNTLYDPNAIPSGTVGTLGEATQAIYAAGFAVGSVTTQIPPTSVFVPENYVISQSPAPGTQAPWGTSINLVISSGEAYSAVVPNLVGMTQSAAITTLQNAPVPPLLKGDAFWSYALTTQSSTTVPAGNVISQNPPPGAAIVQAPYQQQLSFSAYVLGPVSFVVSAGPSPVPSYSYLSQFGSSGGASSQDGQFSGMDGLAIDPVSRNIIVGGEDGRIQIFDSNGNFKSYFGGYGLNLETYNNSLFELQIVDLEGPVGNGLFFTSTQLALAVDPVNRNIIAVDVQGQRVMIFNSAGVFQSEFGTAGLGPGQFRFVNYVNAGVAVDPVTENILVTDAANSRVQVFNSAGVYQSQFGTAGGGYGQFGNPSGIAIDPTTRNIVVADWGANRVDIFNSSGGYLSQFGGPGASDGMFYEPTAIAIDPATHNILVASAGTGNTSNPYLQIFSSAGVYLSQFGGYGTGNGQFTGGSSGLAFDPVSHNIVVTGNNSVQIFGVAASSSGSTTTTLAASSNPAALGQSVTFTATVTGNSPTGTVQFLDGATSLGSPGALTAGVASLATSTLAVGPHSITAVYSGDASNPGSTSAALSEIISDSASTTVLAASVNSVTAGRPVTFTATVTGNSPTGTVQFLNGVDSIGAPASLAGGVAVFTSSTLPVGTDSITAVYSGDAKNNTSTSPALSENVSLAPSSTAVISSADHATLGQSVTFTAVVSGDAPTGGVQFLDAATPLGSPVLLAGNLATLSTSSLTGGTHSITAVFKGDAFNAGSISPALSETISLNIPTTTTLVASVDPVTVGSPVSFTATVKGSSPSGSIQFLDGAAPVGSPVTLTAGSAALLTSALSVGTHSVTAVYSGDTANAPSTSPVLSEVVSPNATSTTITSSGNPSPAGQFITFTATVAGKNPTGSVFFLDGSTPLVNPFVLGNGQTSTAPPSLAPNSRSILLSNGQASITLSSLSVGTHSITSVYLGDSNNGSSTSAVLSQVIQSAAAPPVVTPPVGIFIPATQATGATSSASPLLAAFLASATATSTLPSAPVQLAPQVGGIAVTSATLLPIGATTVTFSFKDSNGNIGSATSTVTVAVGTPRITGSIAGVGSDPSGATYFNIVLTNTGTGNARNLVINTLTYRVLAGTGTLTYNTALSPPLPISIGNLNVGATSTTRIYLNVPTTVTRMGFVESGPVQDVTGTNFTFSTAQIVIP